MAEVDHLARLEQEQAALFAPLKQHYEEIDKEIKDAEVRLTELRETRTRIKSLIRVGDPTFEKRLYKNGSKPGRKPAGEQRPEGFSKQTLEELTVWLQANVSWLNEGDGFIASELARSHHAELPVPGQSRLAKALRKLSDQGVVRLNKLGGRSGRAKYYKVVA